MLRDPSKNPIAIITMALSKNQCKNRYDINILILIAKEFRDIIYKPQSDQFRDIKEIEELVKKALNLTKSSSRVKEIVTFWCKHAKMILKGISHSEYGMVNNDINTFTIK